MTLTYHPLPRDWTVRADGSRPSDAPDGTVPATVPGCVHTDLLAAGLIPDPYLDANERALSWIGETDWVYETTVHRPEAGADRTDLVCAGLDTVATISVNGIEVGRTVNMHRDHRFDVGALLRKGPNSVRVHFASALRHARDEEARLGPRPHVNTDPFNLIRKSACNFGWDWGPRLITAGIWQPIGFQSWSTARLHSVRTLVSVAGDVGRVEVHVDLARTAAIVPLTIRAAVGAAEVEAAVAPGATTAILTLTVTDVALWWPHGYGAQPLYPLTVTLYGPHGEELDSNRRRIGFRSVHLDTTADAAGTAFTLVVNGTPIFVRGANWIPDDVFFARVDRDRYGSRAHQARAAGVNLLRVWGGGRYESEDFYDLADELGLLVWQDFLFACAAYPEEEPLASEVEAEARAQVARLTARPSLVLWAGNNETICGWHSWGWPARLAGLSWGARYYYEVLPAIVAELDPGRPYWPGTPYSGTPDHDPDDPHHGTTHIWDVWNTHDYTRYREYEPRFVAEFGFQAPPAYATLRRAISDEPLTSDSPGMRGHQKADDGDRKLSAALRAHLPEPRDFDDWHYLTQVNQARAIQLGVEHFRALRPLCMGTIVWQLNDCWPVTSWSAVDGDGRRKPLWYALRRAYADRLLTLQPRDGTPALIAVNETACGWTVRVRARRLTVDGKHRAGGMLDLEVPPFGAVTVPLPDEVAGSDDSDREVLVAEGDGMRAWWFFAEDHAGVLPPARFDATAKPTADGFEVVVTALSLLRDLTVFPDRLDPAAEVDDALLTLLPGESATFTVRSTAPLDPAALLARPVLRCVNDIVPDGSAL